MARLQSRASIGWSWPAAITIPPASTIASAALLEEVPELVVERLVHFVQQQDLRVGLLGDRESQPSPHPLRVGQDRTFERVVEAAALLHALEAPHRRAARKARDDAEEHRVLAPGQQRQETCIDREQGRHTAAGSRASRDLA